MSLQDLKIGHIEAALLAIAGRSPGMTVERADGTGGAVYRVGQGGASVEIAVLPGGDVVLDENLPLLRLFAPSDSLVAVELKMALVLGLPPGARLVDAAAGELGRRHPDLPIAGAEMREAERRVAVVDRAVSVH